MVIRDCRSDAMKCTCKECHGSGAIECPDCSGTGTYEHGIDSVKLDRESGNFGELSELQKDARRVIRQAEQLAKLKPERSERYKKQLSAVLRSINKQADELREE